MTGFHRRRRRDAPVELSRVVSSVGVNAPVGSRREPDADSTRQLRRVGGVNRIRKTAHVGFGQ